MDLKTLNQLRADRRDKRAVVSVTDLETGGVTLLYPLQDNDAVSDELAQAAQTGLREDKSRLVEIDGRRLFLNVFNPPLRLIIVGAVHIAQPLSQIGALAGYGVSVIDPREAFATADRFPEMELLTEWPDEALASMAIDHRCAVVTLTHDPKLDDPALTAALQSSSFYIGALGSRKTQGARLERLRRAGFGEQDLSRINGPVGLNVGAKTPAEIAIAIMAQITEALRGERQA